MDPVTARTNMFFGFSSQLGVLGFQASIRALFIYQYNDSKDAQERLSTIEWSQIATIRRIRSNGADQLCIRFYPGRLPENMLDLMLCNQQLTVQMAESKEFVSQMVQLNLVSKINRLVNVHYRPNGLTWFIKRKIWRADHQRSGFYATEESFELNNPKEAATPKKTRKSKVPRNNRPRAIANILTTFVRRSIRSAVAFVRQ